MSIASFGRLLALAAMAWSASALGEPDERQFYFVLQHTPGSEWDHSLSYLVQPGIGEHVQYMSKLHEEGLVVMGGPFLDNSGGMVIVRGSSQEEVTRLAREDPGVRSGLLNVEVRPWQAVLSSVRPAVQRRATPPVAKDEPFTIAPANPEAPINIEEERTLGRP